MTEPVTISRALQHAAAQLSASSTPRLDAEILLARILGETRAHLFAHPEAVISESLARAFRATVSERAKGKPVSQLTGEVEFYSRPFAITKDVLAPRADTEILVECALELLMGKKYPQRVELGTGSGAVAITLALELPNCQILATDISPEALAVAGANVVRLGARNVTLLQSSWLSACAGQRFDLIISNPPYLSSEEYDQADQELYFEPRLALWGGMNGYDAFETLAAEAPMVLKPGGVLAVEHGATQAVGVKRLMEKAGLENISTRRDLAGIERVTSGRKAS